MTMLDVMIKYGNLKKLEVNIDNYDDGGVDGDDGTVVDGGDVFVVLGMIYDGDNVSEMQKMAYICANFVGNITPPTLNLIINLSVNSI